jgi:hypothetical protein
MPTVIMGRGNQLIRTRIREKVIDFNDLPRGVRVLALFNYASVILLLLGTLFFELFGNRLWSVGPPTGEVEVPVAVIVVLCRHPWPRAVPGTATSLQRQGPDLLYSRRLAFMHPLISSSLAH